jgi:hypothetical protein
MVMKVDREAAIVDVDDSNSVGCYVSVEPFRLMVLSIQSITFWIRSFAGLILRCQ